MSSKKKSKAHIRSEPAAASPMITWLSLDDFGEACKNGYTRLADNPDVKICIKKIADLISSMSIYEMQNQSIGNIRIHDGLSRKIDIDPNPYMTRKVLYYKAVEELLLKGNSFLLPSYTKEGYLDRLDPLPHSQVHLLALKNSPNAYKAIVNGVSVSGDNIINFVNNPRLENPYQGRGYNVYLKDVLRNLGQAQNMKSDYYTKHYKPGIIFSFNADNAQYGDGAEIKDGIYQKWIETSPGTPYMLPAELIDFKTFNPMSLNDIAVNDSTNIDKGYIAGLIGVPPYMLGVGKYDKDEYNNFIETTVQPICVMIAQELTKKLLIAPDRFFKFNIDSIKAYDLDARLNRMYEGRALAVYSANEIRIAGGDEPIDKPEMNEYVMLENYIRAEDASKQSKLTGGDEKNG